MRNVRRYFCMPGHPVFITQACEHHEPLLRESARKSLLLQTLAEVRHELDMALYAYVVLDDHVHLLLGAADQRVPKLLGSLKQRMSNELRRHDPKARHRIWQHRFHDHIVRDEDDWRAHLDYLHYNPVRHGYVHCPLEYPWSSFGKLVRQGFYARTWGSRGSPSTIGGVAGRE